jgi:hypothetical protein
MNGAFVLFSHLWAVFILECTKSVPRGSISPSSHSKAPDLENIPFWDIPKFSVKNQDG